MRPTEKWIVLGGAGIAVGVALGVGVFNGAKPQRRPSVPHFRTVDRDRFRTAVAKMSGGAESEATDGAAQEAYDNLAYPAASIAAAQQQAAANAANAIGRLPGGKRTNWQEVGPSGVPASALVASESTGASAGTIYSGRTTAIAISPDCHANDCKIFIGAAGGGVWEADNALASQLNWHPSGNGIPSNAIGSIVFDPNDAKGKTAVRRHRRAERLERFRGRRWSVQINRLRTIVVARAGEHGIDSAVRVRRGDVPRGHRALDWRHRDRSGR